MGTLRRPAGPLPASVYWTRRALVLLLVLAVVLLLRWLWPSGGNGGTASIVTVSPKPTSTARPGVASSPGTQPPTTVASTPPAEPPLCSDSSVAVTVTTDATRYSAGVRPAFTLTVLNTGTMPCRRDVGAKALSLTVTSGGARVWSSDDCQPGGVASVRLLAPRTSVSTSVLWSRVLSAPGCPKGRPAAGPGTYVVVGDAGGVTSPRIVFALG